jgi:hypothetical protein
MILDVSPVEALHLAVALRAHARQLRRDGVEAPRTLLALAEQLQAMPSGLARMTP